MDNSLIYLLVGGAAVWLYQTFVVKKPSPTVPVLPTPVVPTPVAPDKLLQLALEEFSKFLNSMFQNFFQQSLDAHAEKFHVQEKVKDKEVK